MKRTTIYDPRAGESRVFLLDGRTRSTIDYQIWVAESQGVNWHALAATLDELFSSVNAPRVIGYLPWAPSATKKSSNFRKHFAHVNTYANGTCLLAGESEASPLIVSRMLSARSELGGASSGLWSLAAVASLDEVRFKIERSSDMVVSPTLMLAGMMTDLEIGFALDEASDTLLVRLTPATWPFIQRLTVEWER